MLEVLELRSDHFFHPILGGNHDPVNQGYIDDFIPMVTEPTMANTGPRVALTNYTGPSAGGVLIITTPNVTYTGINFGSTRIAVRAANVKFVDCAWDNTTGGGTIDATNTTMTGLSFRFCSFDCHYQYMFSSAITGHDFTVDRCNFNRYVDSLDPFVINGNPGGAIRVVVLSSYFGPMVWNWNATRGIVHPSDNYTHNDHIQHSGGDGLIARGNSFHGYYSTVLGTGTPGSGSDQPGGDSRAPTYAEGVAARTSILRPLGQPDDGGPYGGSIANLMFTPVTGRGPDTNTLVDFNWFYGGAQSVNAAGAGEIPDFGRFWGNRFKRDMRQPNAAISIKKLATVDIPLSGPNRNVWMDDGSTVNRTNG